MGLFSHTFTGTTLILLGTWESILSPNKKPHFSKITLLTTFTLSLLLTLDTTLSLLSLSSPGPTTSLPLLLQSLPVSLLFTLFSLLASLFPPSPLPHLTLLFAFAGEFLLFYLHVASPSSSVEARFYSLMLVPILVCLLCTLVDIHRQGSSTARFGRGVGLIMQGAWIVQMGFSLFTNFVPNNCHLVVKSRGSFVVKCKGHMDEHRGGAIAVLLFNCHLAVILAVVVGVYGVFGRKVVGGEDYGRLRYRPLGEVKSGVVVGGDGRFTLDSDEDESGEIKVEERGEVRRENGGSGGAVELAVNGFGLHR